MSTKTSIKRIAAVAALALTVGGFSAVSAHAGTPTNTFTVTGFTGTGTGTVSGTATTGKYLPVTLGFATETNPVVNLTSTGVGTLAIPTIAPASSTAATTAVTATGATIFSSNQSSDVPGSYTTGLSSLSNKTIYFSAYSTVAGTQTISVVGSSGTSTLTITWGAAPVVSAANSTSYITDTTTAVSTSPIDAIGTSVSADSVLVKDKAVGSNRAGIIVTLKDSSGTTGALVKSAALSASVTGAGLVAGYAGSGTTPSSFTSYAKTATAYTDSVTGVAAFSIQGDNTSGVGTITITYTNPTTGASTTISTETITFYSTTVAALKATQVLKVAKTDGTALGAVSGSGSQYLGTSSDTFGTTGSIPAFYVSATDANGNATAPEDGTWSITSSDTTVFSSQSSVTPIVETSAGNTGVGTFDFAVTPVSGATSGKSADISVTFTPTNTLHAAVTTKVGTFAIGGSTIYGLAFTSDAGSYTVGDKVTLSLNATDKSGNAIADGNYNIFGASFTGLTFSSQITSTPYSTTSGNTLFVGGVKTATLYAPYADGAVKFTGALTSAAPVGTALATAGAVNGTINVTTASSGAAQAAVDAANEATDAANAATDAANNAMDSADAAQQAALDAGDKADAALAAVTDLATKVSAIASQIAALSALVKKIAAKVKA